MIKYLNKEYKNIDDLAGQLGVSERIANHLYHVNGGKCDDQDDLKSGGSLFVKEEKVVKETKELKVDSKKETKSIS